MYIYILYYNFSHILGPNDKYVIGQYGKVKLEEKCQNYNPASYHWRRF